MEAQVLKSLGKLKKLLPRNQKELKDVIDAATVSMTAALERKTKAQGQADGGGGGGGVGGGTEVPFEPFLLAVLTRQAKLVAIALDCIEKFLAFGFLRGNGSIPESIRKRLVQKYGKKAFGGSSGGSGSSSGRDSLTSGSGSAGGGGGGGSSGSSGGGGGADGAGDDASALNEENWKLIDCIIEVICDTNDHPDETVQIQVLRVLLTAVTTPTCEVHEHSLLKAVRACYHIHLVSKNTTNQTVAKATLQQIISIVFQRMETFDQRVQDETEATLRESLQKSASRTNSNTSSSGTTSATASFVSSSSETIVALHTASWYPDVVRTLQIPLDKTSEPRAPVAVTVHHPNHASTIFAPSFPSVLHKDAFLLFRSLCRISMRSVAEDSALSGGFGGTSSSTSLHGVPGAMGGTNSSAADDPFAFQSKILSLELVLSIINNAGPSFRRGERFIHAIRQYLCQSLLQNCTSNYTQIVGLSLQLFLVLINNFKRHLKAEIEIFVTSIFLRILQSEHSSFEHKMLVLEVLNNICDDAHILGEIFLNYDCDWNTNDLFKQIVDALAKIAKGKKDTNQAYASMSSSVRAKMLANDAALVLKGLECLCATVSSLKKAANFVEKTKNQQDAAATGATSSTHREDGSDESAPPPTSHGPLPTPPPPSSVSSSLTMSAVEAFDRKKRRQEELANGILKFNNKPSAGIQYLVQHGHLGDGTPRDVARFLHEQHEKLDKTQVGDYLGKEAAYQNGFCVKTLHEYVDMMDFTGLEIDVAIRQFLSGFRLPGEAQKIDRMMEKFAERYYSTCPPGLFPSADTAFILSFSIIMLQTDLHNPSVPEEKKMDKAGYIRNNRGINNGEDLPEEYLSGIYDRIKQNPISLKEDEELKARSGVGGGRGAGGRAAPGLFGASSAVVDRQRRDAYIKERESIVRQSEALFKRRNPGNAASMRGGFSTSPRTDGSSSSTLSPSSSSSSSQFHVVSELTEMSHVRPMFETVWAPLLACCSVIFESSDAPVAIQLCLNSFKSAIHLAARLDMPSERDAFVTVLAKFTALHTTGARLMKAKHIEAIKALISISVKEGNYLGDAWRDILQCISQLARLQTHAQGLNTDADFFRTSGRNSGTTPSSSSTPTASHGLSVGVRRGFGGSSTPSGSSSSISSSPSHGSGMGGANGPPGSGGMNGEEFYNPAIEDENAARVMAEIDALASDRVFSSSVSLSDTAVQEFVVQLCVVSLSECSGVSNGRGVVQTARNMDSALFSAPRVFSLQKLVEVADMNMPVRSRMVWASTWKVLSRHFTTIGCHDNLSIAMYAIDSLRQLSMRFLEKEELKDFNFQRLFLAPFEVIMANALSTDIKELVLRCVENMILARVVNIRSGWKTIWGVLRVAAETYEHGDDESSETADRIVQLGFQIAKRIFEHHFDRIVDVFVDAVECVLAFAVCGSEDLERGTEEHIGLTQISVDAIAILETVCLEKLATGQVIEKVFVETTAAKRVGFTKKKKKDEGGETAATNSAATVAPGRPPLRYEKQESSRTLEEEISALSPPSTPTTRRRSTLTTPLTTTSADAHAVYNDSAAHTRMWWPVLTALSTLAADRRLDVRLAAVTSLYESLETHGTKFSSGLWSLIFKGVLIPLLDELRHLEVFVEKNKRPPLKLTATRTRFEAVLNKSTSTLCLERLLETYGLFFDVVGFLPEVLFLLGKCMDTNDREEDLAAASAAALEKMLVVHGHKFPEDVWGLIADELRSVMTRAEPTWIFFTLPDESETPPSVASPTRGSTPLPPPTLLSPRQPSVISMYPSVPHTLKIRFAATFPPKIISDEEIRAQNVPSRTHLIVILAVQKVLGNVLTSRVPRNLSLSEGHALSLMNCLRESFLFARKVNDAIALRRHLAKQGWVYGRVVDGDLPNVLLQEVQGKDEYLKVLFHLITSSGHDDRKREDARRQMTTLIRQTIDEYLAWTVPSSPQAERLGAPPVDVKQRVVRYKSLLVSLLTHVAQFSGDEIRRHLSWLYPLLNELIKTENVDVRSALMHVYSKSISQLLPLQMAAGTSTNRSPW